MKKNYLILLFMFIATTIFAQQNVSIHVKDNVSLLPIQGAKVTTNSQTLLTDVNGDVTFTGFLDGLYDIEISSSCHSTFSQSFTVSGAAVVLDYKLNPLTKAPVFFNVNETGSPMSFPVGTAKIAMTDGVNSYSLTYSEFDNIIADVAFGTYDYTITTDCHEVRKGSVTVDCSAIDAMSGNVAVFEVQGVKALIDTSVSQVNNVLTANASGATIGYQWVDCNSGNSPIDGATNQTYTATTNGSYAVIISNCSDSQQSSCYAINNLSIDSINSPLSIILFPNPINEELNLQLNSTYDKIDIQVYSMLGQLIKTVSISNTQECRLNLAGLSSGSYLVKINADGKTESSVVIKK